MWLNFYGSMPLLTPTTGIGGGPSPCLKKAQPARQQVV